MIVFTARNTNEMMSMVYEHLLDSGVLEQSRNGLVYSYPYPVAFQYTHPEEMVNMCSVRDCNPFFHLMEAMAIIAGHNSVEFLAHFCSNISQYSDDGETFNAFYGTRLGRQLYQVIELLHKDRATRQAVVQLWDKSDLLKETKDKACNISLVFRITHGLVTMTVYNRSNDLIYGGVAGANIVQFAMVQLCVANALNRDIGPLTVVSNNAHVYEGNPLFDKLLIMGKNAPKYRYRDIDITLKDCEAFMRVVVNLPDVAVPLIGGGEFINKTVIPMYNTWQEWKTKRGGNTEQILDPNWEYAAHQWLLKRV